MYRVPRFMGVIVVLALIFAAALQGAAFAAAAEVVDPAVSNWGFVNEGTGTGAYAFVPGPADHSGSLKLTTAVSTDGPYFAGLLTGFNLPGLTVLQYDVYSPNPTSLMPTLQLDVDYDSTDLVTGWQGRLVFVPNGPFTEDSWQTLNALSDTDGTWFGTGGAGKTACPLAAPCTWSTVQSTFPNLVLYSSWAQATVPGSGAIGLKKGSSETAPFEGYVDNLVIDLVTYDFEPLWDLYVDDDWSAVTPGADPDGAGPAVKFGVDSFATIQAAIDAAVTGSTISVASGTYVEQLTITKSLQLVGAGAGASLVQAPATLPAASLPTSTIVLVSGAGVDAEITGFTIEGPGPSGCGSIRSGIFVRDNANAEIHDNSILDIRDAALPVSGCQNGIAIIVGRQAWSTSGTATIANNTIIGYQKGGIVVDNTGSNAVITNNTITGAGTISITAQNGIQISRGAAATLSGNTVTGNSYHLDGSSWDWGATGILLYQAGDVTLTGGNTVTGNDNAIYNEGSASLTLGAETIGDSTAPVDSGYDVIHLAGYPLDLSAVTFAGSAGNFAIEDRVWHRLDDASLGLATWIPQNLYVTSLNLGIQAAVDAAGTGDTVNVASGSFAENVVVNKSLTLAGSGAGSTIVMPAVSDPNCGGAGGGSLCTGASNVFLVQANNVVIHDLTVEGDNPALTSTYDVGGANLDARNGIITNHLAGVFNGLEVYNTTVQNVYLRGLYASSGGTFNFHDNTVANVRAEYASIAMFAWGGPGTMANNTVSYANDAISANHSKGIQFLNNTVSNSGSGIHTDNSNDGGGTPDLIQGNTVTDCDPAGGGYGIWTFVPYAAPTVDNNTVTNCDIGLSAWGEGAPVTTHFTNNTVTGPAKKAGSVGAYITSDIISWGYRDVSVNFTGNVITGFETGVLLTADQQSWNPEPFTAQTITAAFHSNQIHGNTKGAEKGTAGTYLADFEENWWGAPDGPSGFGPGSGDSVVAGFDFMPWCADAACTVFNPTLTVAANDKLIQVGEADPAFDFTYSGFVMGHTAADVDTPPACSVSVPHAAAGTYPIVCSGGADGDYVFAYVDGTLTVNTPPTDISLTAASLTENHAIGYTIATLGNNDPDPDTFTYSGCGGADDASFTIDGNALKTAAVFDFEVRNSYPDLCIRVEDGKGGSFQETFAITVTDLPETFYSIAGQDGWILESTETSNTGGTRNYSETTFRLGDDALNRQYRSILAFRTTSLPDNAVVTGAVLKIRRESVVGVNPFTTHKNLVADIRKGYFGTYALQLADFNSAASMYSGAVFGPSPLSGGWYSAMLKPAALPKINTTGVTQFRLRFQLDDNNDHGQDYVKFHSGNSVLANVPVLVLEYYIP